jgi:hypothetical protein
MRWPSHALLAFAFTFLPTTAIRADAPPTGRHPNLLLNRAEIELVKKKIKDRAWAARLFERVKALADDHGRTTHNPREAALVYALTGELGYADAVRQALLGHARRLLPQYAALDVKLQPDYGAWGPLATWAWSYDLTYDVFAPGAREEIEHLLRTAARTIIAGLAVRAAGPDLDFGKHIEVGLVGYCLRDRELIDWALNDPGRHGPAFGGFYRVLDTNVRDRYFWGEAPRYALGRSLQGMLALAEAARHFDGTDLYHHVSPKSGAGIKSLIDGYLRLAYPLERTGLGLGSLRMATFGDSSTRYTPKGELVDTFLVNPIPGGPKQEVTLTGELEIAYARYHDPGYAWLLALNPDRDAYIDTSVRGNSGKVWGYVALTHGETLPADPPPPPAPGGVYPGQGIAVLRSDESPAYWTSGAVAVVLRLGSAIGHGHPDYFHLILHGKGRLLYPDLELITYEPTYLNWAHEGIGHNTLLVDHQSPRPGPFATRQDLAPEVKFVAVTGSAYEAVGQTRALFLTPDYLADLFRAADTQGRERTFDWVVHGLGRLYPGRPAAYRPTQALLPYYWWVDNERGRTADSAWQADWVQHSAGATPGLQLLGREWFADTVGVRLTMLGVTGTEVYTGDGPLTDGPPYHRLDGNTEGSSPLVLARRHSSATTFSAIHEPYRGRPLLRSVRLVQETATAVGMAVEAEAFSDRVLVAFNPSRKQTLGAAGESFTFHDHAYLRLAAGRLTVRGQLSAFRLRVSGTGAISATRDGQPLIVRRDGDFLVFGPSPAAAGDAETAERTEVQAAVHYYFSPEEVHLAAGAEKAATMHLRCMGPGKGRGRLLLKTPEGISVEPSSVDLSGLAEGDEAAVQLRVKAAAETSSGLRVIQIEPVENAPAAPGTLLLSVGVVITEDRRVPMIGQMVVRAPQYTIKVDHQSGVACFLLDADGHRRHGAVNNGPRSYLGTGAVEQGGKWSLRYRTPCRFVWPIGNNLVVVSGEGSEQVRLRYTFHEDHLVLGLIAPTNPTRDYDLWLGEFDDLGNVRHNGAPAGGGKEPAPAASWFFFPHPVHRQGVLIVPSRPGALVQQGTAIRVRVRAGDEVTLRFAAANELPMLVAAP